MRLVVSFLIVSMLTLAAVVTIIYFQQAAVLKDMEFEKLQVVRDLKLREVTSWIDERMGDLTLLAEDLAIRSANIENAFLKDREDWTQQEHEAIDAAREIFQRYMMAYDTYHELFYVGAASQKVEVCINLSHEGRDVSKDLYYTEPMSTGNPYIKGIYFSETEGQPAMTFSAPIFCQEHAGEHIIGVVVARVDLEHSLYPLLQERTGMGETGETLIVNQEGIALNELRWAERAPLKLEIVAEPAMRGAAGETGIVETDDYRGEKVLAAYSHVPLVNWGLVVKRDLAEVYAPIRTMLRYMIILGLVTALIVVLVSVLLARSISRPILNMGEAVERFAAGDLEARWSIKGADEVTALGESFNKMASIIASQNAIRDGSARISETMISSDKIDNFASELLLRLLDISGSNLGAFYMRVGEGQLFESVSSVGLTDEAVQSFNAEGYEGELGAVLATGRIAHIQDIPRDTVFTFKTTSGMAIPREIITIPLTVDRRIQGIISLATLGSYSDTHREILQQVQLGMDTAFSNLLEKAKTERLAEELGASNEEMTSVNEELQEQTEELQAQADELDAQRIQVVEANRLKSEFLSNMSHELRTPLNSVLALSQLMLSRGVGSKPEEDAEHLHVIERNGQRLLRLINDILDLSKIEAGRVELSISSFDPRELVERALGTVQPLVDEQGLQIEVRLSDVPMMRSDEERISQILLNLLSNAVKFTEHGQINVNVSASEGMVSFAVTDSGIGIDETNLSHIFEEFRQIDGSTTRRYEGTGLGLSICQRLAHLLGGRISVESALEEGSMFTLHLPVQCPPGLIAADSMSSATPQIATRPSRISHQEASREAQFSDGWLRDNNPLILVIEDNEVAALQVRSVLEESGCRVSVADGGVAGLKAVKKEVPDAIILDLMMPEVDGFQVLEQIRSKKTTENLPVLVLTAKELTVADRSRLTRNNIHQLIQKGDVDRDQLVTFVAAMLGKQEISEPPRPTATHISGEASSSEQSRTILIVEDNSDNLLTIKAILDDIDAEYITALDGEQAVRAAKEFHPGLILMDIQLPVMSGIEATRRIKADPSLKNTPIIALTAKAMAGDREEILAAGCDDYLSKPLDASKVTDIVQEWLGLQQEKG